MYRYPRQIRQLSEIVSLHLKLHTSLFSVISRLAISELPYRDNSVRVFSLAPLFVSPNFNEQLFSCCHSFLSNMSIERSLIPESSVSHNRDSRCPFQSVLESREWLNIDVILHTSCSFLPPVVYEECLPELHGSFSSLCQMEERLSTVHGPERTTFASGTNAPVCSLWSLEEMSCAIHCLERNTLSLSFISESGLAHIKGITINRNNTIVQNVSVSLSLHI